MEAFYTESENNADQVDGETSSGRKKTSPIYGDIFSLNESLLLESCVEQSSLRLLSGNETSIRLWNLECLPKGSNEQIQGH